MIQSVMMTSKEGRFLCKVKIETAMRALRHPQTGIGPGIGLLVYQANMSGIEVYFLKKVLIRCTYILNALTKLSSFISSRFSLE